jgi:mono/diheme cytochrome c family protein
MLKRVLSGIAFTIVLAGGSLADANSVSAGKALYVSHCSGCHRANGAGGLHFGKAVSADLQAPGLENTYHHSTKLLVRAILDARDEDGDRLDRPMPAWKGRLSRAQALDIIAFLKTLHA